jgi:squalene cyclase
VKTYQTTSEYRASQSNSVEISKGDTLIVGEEYKGNPNWVGWIKCTHTLTGKESWVPKQLIKITGSEGAALSDYSAKELTVAKGVKVGVQKKMNGWSWCRTESGEEGWLPDDAI